MKLILVSGGAASGKSEYAENLLLQLGKGAGKTYLATMLRDGREAEERIARHTALRKGKGFSTVECSADITRVISACKEAVLLEDLSNLVANEMFGAGEKRQDPVMTREKDTAKRVAADVLQLAKHKELLVVVMRSFPTDCFIRRKHGSISGSSEEPTPCWHNPRMRWWKWSMEYRCGRKERSA